MAESHKLMNGLNDMEDKHEEGLNFYQIDKPEKVDDIMGQYDSTYEHFYERKNEILEKIKRLSALHHGEGSDDHQAMMQNTQAALMQFSSHLVSKRNNFLRKSIRHLPEDQQQSILE